MSAQSSDDERLPELPGLTDLRSFKRGGMGVVCLARQKLFERQVVVKLLAGALTTPAEKTRFLDEIHTAADLRHDNIVTVYQSGEVDGRFWFSMEYCPGGSLDERLKERTLAAREAAELLCVLADAVQYAHLKGIVHRDLKPANVLFTANGVAKLADFGVARRLDPNLTAGLTATGQVLGTPSYMAPEQIRNSSAVGPAADVYGLGAVLYEATTGRPPFQGESVADILRKVEDTDPVAPRRLQRTLPRDLETICLKCLGKEPEKRYASAADFAADLRRYLANEPIRARPTGPVGRTIRWARRRPAVAALLLGILVLSAIGIGQTIQRLRNERRGAHEVLVRRAKSAASTGDLNTAGNLYDEAIAHGHEDEVDLRVERLPMLFDSKQRPRLGPELKALSQQHGVTIRQRAYVDLFNGEVGLWETDPGIQANAIKCIGAAIDSGGLDPADSEYAEAIRARGYGSATRHLNAALQMNPTHARAGNLLLMELVLCGRFREAATQSTVLRRQRPNDRTPAFADALAALLQEDEQAFIAFRAEAFRIYDDKEDQAAFDRAFQTVRETIAFNKSLHAPPKKGLLSEFFNAVRPLAAIGKMQTDLDPFRDLTPAQRGRIAGAVSVGQPALYRSQQLTQLLVKAYGLLIAKKYEAAIQVVEQSRAEYPEALLLCIASNAWMGVAERDRGKSEEKYINAYECVRRFALAAESAPTAIPFGPYRRNVRWVRLLVELELNFLAVRDATVAVGDTLCGSSWDVLAPTIAAATHKYRPLFPTREACNQLIFESRGYDEGRNFLLPQLALLMDPVDARLLLEDWLQDEPRDPQPAELLAQLEFSGNALGAGGNNYSAAVRAAGLALDRGTRMRKEMIDIRTKSQALMIDAKRNSAQGKTP